MEEAKKQIIEQSEKSKEGDIENGEIGIAILGYILPFLFFVPLLDNNQGKNKFGKFHANQQLICLIFLVVGLFVAQVLRVIFIGYILFVAMVIFYWGCMLFGIIASIKKETKKLPIIGSIEIIS